MTFQPPPPPPGAQPPQQPNQPYGAPPPAGQQWGAPPPPAPGAVPPPPAAYPAPQQGGYPAPSAGFDAKAVNPLDWGILGAGALTFIFSFLSYYTASVKAFGVNYSVHENAWHGFFGWFGMLCAVAGSALVGLSLFAPQVKLPVPARLGGLGLYAVALVCLLLAWFITPGVGGSVDGVDFGRGIGFYGSLLFVIVGLVLSLMRFQQGGGKLPGALGNIPNIGGHGPR